MSPQRPEIPYPFTLPCFLWYQHLLAFPSPVVEIRWYGHTPVMPPTRIIGVSVRLGPGGQSRPALSAMVSSGAKREGLE